MAIKSGPRYLIITSIPSFPAAQQGHSACRPHRGLRHTSVVSWYDLDRPDFVQQAPRPALSHVWAACGGLREHQGLKDGGDTSTQQLSFAILPGHQDDQAIRGCSTNADTHFLLGDAEAITESFRNSV